MTIREYLKRRGNRMVLVVLPGIIFWYLSAKFAPASFWLNWLSLLVLFAGVVAVFVLMGRTPCPRCHRPLGKAAGSAANLFWRFDVHCPHCGVSVDEQMDNPANK